MTIDDVLAPYRRKQKRGFAAMSKEKHLEIARKGGQTVAARGTGHQFTSEEAKIAGRRGGAGLVAKVGKEHMRELGRRGGQKKAENCRRRCMETGRVASATHE